MTLAEFLLARIAEADTDVHRFECDTVSSEGYRPCDCDYPAVVMAECEAKRRIVEFYAETDRMMVASRPGMDHVSAALVGAEGALVMAVGLLAQPYADHPDYDEAWRAIP